MTENMQPNNDSAQLKALMQVINEITAFRVPLQNSYELSAKSALRELKYVIDDLNALDDSDLIDTLQQARTEIKYLCTIIRELKTQVENLEADGQMLADRLRRAN